LPSVRSTARIALFDPQRLEVIPSIALEAGADGGGVGDAVERELAARTCVGRTPRSVSTLIAPASKALLTTPPARWRLRRFARSPKRRAPSRQVWCIIQPADRGEGTMGRVTILFLGANPSNETHLKLTKEAQAIDDLLRRTDHRDRYNLEQQWEVQARRLQSLIMRFKPQIVHFSGHGSQRGELVFQNEHGRSDPLDPAAIAAVFNVFSKYVQCVVLNACFSLPQAELIAKSIDVVIGMGRAIGDDDAIAFAGQFYEALGYGEDVETAFAAAKNAIAIEKLPGSDVPTLLPRNGVEPSRLRFVEEQSRP
jgi:hypothetical protein